MIVVITSINSPTIGIQKLIDKNYDIIVVADKKTPSWKISNLEFLSIKKQKELKFNLIDQLPFNHYSRKNIGYLHAIQKGALMIYDTDDDNILLNNWNILRENSEYKTVGSNKGFVNIYRHFTNKKIWPRGYPIEKINDHFSENLDLKLKKVSVPIWQGLANQDPDVDALYRLTNSEMIDFEDNEPIVLRNGTICPFNSQNTIFSKFAFALLYLPSTVSFRFTDILRSYIAQAILWQYGKSIGFRNATVKQIRNEHNLLEDLKSELTMYEHSPNVIDIIIKVIASHKTITQNLFDAYKALFENGIVEKKELTLVNSWILDLEELGVC